MVIEIPVEYELSEHRNKRETVTNRNEIRFRSDKRQKPTTLQQKPTLDAMTKQLLSPGTFGLYLGYRVLIRRVAVIMGQAQYWILMPTRTNSFAWIPENEMEKE